MLALQKLSSTNTTTYLPALIELLQDSVESGASIGFLPPLSYQEAEAYWQSVFTSVADGSRILLIATDDERGVGTVQLDLCQKANGLHRAEVMKVMVHTSARRRGLGRRLMQAIEEEARAAHRTTLVLDTREGDASNNLYQSVGWQLAGVIPQFARNADGSLAGTVLYYKLV